MQAKAKADAAASAAAKAAAEADAASKALATAQAAVGVHTHSLRTSPLLSTILVEADMSSHCIIATRQHTCQVAATCTVNA
jgi:hypothetical protein